jgi:hypothetical protein
MVRRRSIRVSRLSGVQPDLAGEGVAGVFAVAGFFCFLGVDGGAVSGEVGSSSCLMAILLRVEEWWTE